MNSHSTHLSTTLGNVCDLTSSPEPIRLVIWDLDETFWRGTLTEGGIREYVQEHHDIVTTLAKRGIISSICSKNDYQPVADILKERGILDYFIFPSIDWTAKGPRLKELIEDVQLRPETVLFIDDNPGNRAEAAEYVPRLQIADESVIPSLLTHELFKGKDDTELTRLKQYQLLQRRKKDEAATGANNIEFLRSSNMRVLIEPNVEAHLDRAVELINRTNQLNFTKIRLSDDKETAKNELKKLINNYYYQAGLVRVWDNYGDYGFCGFYLLLSVQKKRELKHFCFSCRVLGMGVEHWLFQRLGVPTFDVKDDAQANLKKEEVVDWINQELNGNLYFSEGRGEIQLPDTNISMQSLIPEIRNIGGCGSVVLSHYLQQDAKRIVSFTNYIKNDLFIRFDNTTNLGLSLLMQLDTTSMGFPFSSLSTQIKNEINALGLNECDFSYDIFISPPPNTLFVMCTWGDLYLPVYRHKTLGFDISVALYDFGISNLCDTSQQLDDLFATNTEFFTEERKAKARHIVNHFASNYTYIGITDETSLRYSCEKIFERIPENCMLAFILPNYHRGTGTATAMRYHAIVNEVAERYSNVYTIDVSQFIQKQEDIQGTADHFDRMVYFNLYKTVMTTYSLSRNMP